jgi:hypothetical protein
MSYAERRAWSDRFTPTIKQIVGPYLLTTTPEEIDCTQAADLMIFTAHGCMIAARVRTPGYIGRYLYDVTLRSRCESGARTELQKIVDGFADWFFYGHSDDAETGFAAWWLINMKAIRAALIRRPPGFKMGEKRNGDGSCFMHCDLRTFPDHPPLLIGSSQPLPPRQNRRRDAGDLFSGMQP